MNLLLLGLDFIRMLRSKDYILHLSMPSWTRITVFESEHTDYIIQSYVFWRVMDRRWPIGKDSMNEEAQGKHDYNEEDMEDGKGCPLRSSGNALTAWEQAEKKTSESDLIFSCSAQTEAFQSYVSQQFLTKISTPQVLSRAGVRINKEEAPGILHQICLASTGEQGLTCNSPECGEHKIHCVGSHGFLLMYTSSNCPIHFSGFEITRKSTKRFGFDLHV